MDQLKNILSYAAVIGDIKASRHLENRREVQKDLQRALEQINRKYAEDITSKFLITLGDEFQGLLCSGKNILNMINEIKMEMYPVRIRFGVGFGTITTDIWTEMALGADGPGYYRAREAIETLKEQEKKKRPIPADICIRMKTVGRTGSEKLSGTCCCIQTVRKIRHPDYRSLNLLFRRHLRQLTIIPMKKHYRMRQKYLGR